MKKITRTTTLIVLFSLTSLGPIAYTKGFAAEKKPIVAIATVKDDKKHIGLNSTKKDQRTKWIQLRANHSSLL